MKRIATGGLALLMTVTAACGGGSGTGASDTTAQTPGDLQVQVASYDLRTGRPQRVLLGLLTAEARLVGGGELRLEFSYSGTAAGPAAPEKGFSATGTYRLVAGQADAQVGKSPGLVEPGGPAGVYGADDVEFPKAGFWRVAVPVTMDGRAQSPSTTFEVKDDSTIPYVGDPAPRTQNHVLGSTEVPPKAIDSRASEDGSIPDPELHSLTVDQSVASAKPTMVVVSTPTYCVSRFCGPITERVQALGARNKDAMNFIHLEVWKDFEGKAINKAAAEWIYPTRTEDATEPWVFVIDKSGVITHRFDNIATDAELEGAVAAAVGGGPGSSTPA